ncbi:INO80 complex, subunit Ies4 [Microdochium trichocladiopsis]|uniref:INO80 complex, subunit Ies4 n=1 Tax=Microdochium trichocladiopsis TaxID=1682393 RepID=A0A9P9BM31_9PEZI|nr:INO80 complex, subunit Ies4 [Microdochium trichocladiopsis]KAH7025873.1 INO80 complex, subunit Ies4 [Microdochium trichocladiopsis]
MAPQDKGRRSSGKITMLVTLQVNPDKLRKIVDPSTANAEASIKESPAPEVGTPAEIPTAASSGENASDSTPGTPSSQAVMGPPSDTLKKKGVKRSAAGANGNEVVAKVRGKPGPKKKLKLDDGETARASAYHKLGPKANQGAINAGLRALDRSGTPCRKWQKGGFTLKSFTGVVWGIPRWTAPPKAKADADSSEGAGGSAESSNKENKDGSQAKSEKSASNAGGDNQQDVSKPPSVRISSPAPAAATPIAAAS